MNNKALIKVPQDDSDSLKAVAATLGDSGRLISARPLDGQIMAELLVTLTPASVSVLRSWIRARAESRRAYYVSINGTELTGYSAREVDHLIASLEKLGDNAGDEG